MMRYKNSIVFLIILLCIVIVSSSHALKLPEDRLEIAIPSRWKQLQSELPVILLARDSIPQREPATSQVFYNNLVMARVEVSPGQLSAIKEDFKMYLKSTLYVTYPAIEIASINDRVINGIRGIFVESSIIEAGKNVSTLQFYFLQNDKVYSVVISTLSHVIEQNRGFFEECFQSLHRLK